MGCSAPLGKLVHEQLALQLTLSKESSREAALECGWFFFELMIKAMVEHLATAGTLTAPRKHRLLLGLTTLFRFIFIVSFQGGELQGDLSRIIPLLFLFFKVQHFVFILMFSYIFYI